MTTDTEERFNAGRRVIGEMVEWSDPSQAILGVQIEALFEGWHLRHGFDDDFVPEQAEAFQHLPLINPATGVRSRTFTHAGKVDGLVSFRGRPYLFEAKTTSDDITDLYGPYWSRLDIDSQVSKYVLQCLQSGINVEGIVYDVTSKPRTKPKKITKADQKRIIAGEEYFGGWPNDEDIESIEGGDDRETLGLYSLRLKASIREDPDAFFRRQIVVRRDAEVAEYASELWGVADDIRRERIRGLHPKNSGACWDFNRPCPYLAICRGVDSPDSENWTTAATVHPELESDFDDGGRQVLTNSRVQTFQRCRRKHFYRYERGIVRIEHEHESALWFGSIWHAAIEAYFNTQIRQAESEAVPS